MKTGMESVQQAFYKISEKLYQQEAPTEGDADTGQDQASGTYEADFKDAGSDDDDEN